MKTQVQINVMFDLEDAADQATTMARIDQMFRAAGVTPGVLPVNPNQQHLLAGEPPPAEARTQQLREQAAKARAAKAAKAEAQAQATALDPDPVVDLTGPANGDGTGTTDDADDLGLAPTTMSPAEAKEASLALLRDIYAVHPANVKALQKDLKVAKFSDVPVSDGHAFYKQVVKIAQDVGMRV
jgi:hypothetical protein